jgi:hypothetical protein
MAKTANQKKDKVSTVAEKKGKSTPVAKKANHPGHSRRKGC